MPSTIDYLKPVNQNGNPGLIAENRKSVNIEDGPPPRSWNIKCLVLHQRNERDHGSTGTRNATISINRPIIQNIYTPFQQQRPSPSARSPLRSSGRTAYTEWKLRSTPN